MALRIDRSGVAPELYLYGEIAAPAWYMGGEDSISAQAVIDGLAEVAGVKEIVVRINSPGGDVFEGVAIYQALQRFSGRVRVEVDALAASIASVIAMAGAEIVIAGNGMLMIHRAWTIASGNAEELAKVAESLKKIDESILATYTARAGDKAESAVFADMMAAETWLTAQEAVDVGLADRAGELRGVAASVKAGRFKNCPAHLIERAKQVPPKRSTITQIAARLSSLRERTGRPSPAA